MQKAMSFIKRVSATTPTLLYSPEIQLNKFLGEHPDYRVHSASINSNGTVFVIFDIEEDDKTGV